ncbi:MAG TPA: FtsX-like permease family protein, partial [Desulfobacterales bacterium]|nr:FtsX-like permease family protein [Desulfobacterales bacterium]
MKPPHPNPLLLWAARDVIRRPAPALLMAAALALLLIVGGTVLLLGQGLSQTARRLLAHGPDLVVRRLNAGGWAPLPAAEALAAARGVPGVTRAQARVWGVAAGPAGPLMVIAWGSATLPPGGDGGALAVPRPGEALLGPGVDAGPDPRRLPLAAAATLEFQPLGRLTAETDLLSQDVVLVHPADARRLLGLAPGEVVDLAVEVFHAEEAAALLPELAAAFPWPVRITARSEAVGLYAGGLARRGGLMLIAGIPAVLALVLVVAGAVREAVGRRREVGLLKALGWTTGDVVRLQVYRALLIALPAACLGMLAAYALVLRPGVSWPGSLLFGWRTAPPRL